VARAYPQERGHRLGPHSAAENGGVVLGPVLGGAVLAISTFHAAFIVAGLIGALALLAMQKIPRDALTSAPPAAAGRRPRLRPALREARRGVRQILSDRAIRLVSLVEAMLWLGMGSLQAYLPLYAVSIRFPSGRSACSPAGRAWPRSPAGPTSGGVRTGSGAST
jgi:MFS transporter, DHA1 family, multidrug resistance protein